MISNLDYLMGANAMLSEVLARYQGVSLTDSEQGTIDKIVRARSEISSVIGGILEGFE